MAPTEHLERNKGLRAPLGPNVGASRWGMRPARISGLAQRVAPVHESEVKVSSARTASVSGGNGVLSGTGAGKEGGIWTEDQVQRSRWSYPGGSCQPTGADSGGGDVYGSSGGPRVSLGDGR